MKILLPLAAVIALFSLQSAHALTFYTSKAAFDAAATTALIEDFENTGQSEATAIGSFSHNGLNFSGLAGVPFPNVYLIPSGDSGYAAGISNPVPTTTLAANGDENIVVGFDTPYRAVGLDIYLNGLGPLEVRVYDGATLLGTYVFPGAENDKTYLGFTNDTAVTGFQFVSSLGASINTAMDNISAAEAIPEPGTLAVLALGFLTLGLRRHRA
ncbi:MAG: PEP-CTERM sorting domain-containing protein [Rhodospirillales bacterium]